MSSPKQYHEEQQTIANARVIAKSILVMAEEFREDGWSRVEAMQMALGVFKMMRQSRGD